MEKCKECNLFVDGWHTCPDGVLDKVLALASQMCSKPLWNPKAYPGHDDTELQDLRERVAGFDYSRASEWNSALDAAVGAYERWVGDPQDHRTFEELIAELRR